MQRTRTQQLFHPRWFVRAADAGRYVACDHSGSLSLYDKGGRDEIYSPVRRHHEWGNGESMRRAATLLSAIALSGLAATPKQQARYDFSAPVNLGRVVNSPAFDGGPSISADGLSLFFTSERPGGSGGGDLWVTQRKRVTDPFTVPENLAVGLLWPLPTSHPASRTTSACALYVRRR